MYCCHFCHIMYNHLKSNQTMKSSEILTLLYPYIQLQSSSFPMNNTVGEAFNPKYTQKQNHLIFSEHQILTNTSYQNVLVYSVEFTHQQLQMRNELSLAFSNFSLSKTNCHPISNSKFKRKRFGYFRRQNNQSVLEGEELQISYAMMTKQMSATSYLQARSRKELEEKRKAYELKYSDLLIEEYTKKVAKSITDQTTQCTQERPQNGQISVCRKRINAQSSIVLSTDAITNSERKMFMVRKQMLAEKAKKRKNYESKDEPTQLLTIKKLLQNEVRRQHQSQQRQSFQKPKRIQSAISGVKTLQRSKISKLNKKNFKKADFNANFHSSLNLFKGKQTNSWVGQQISELQISFAKASQKIHLQHQQIKDFDVKTDIFGKAFSISHLKDGSAKVIHQKNSTSRMQIASLTKIMTCILILQITNKFRIDIKTTQVLVSYKASLLKGTSALLQAGNILTVYDLLHGLMLPSGNDAALALAQWGGKTIRRMCQRKSQSPSPRTKKFSKISPISTKSTIQLFIYHMNAVANELNMFNTKFANPHGLMNRKSYSCSDDLTKLCIYAMKNQIFREIVGKRLYHCRIYNRKFANFRELLWHNTNKLLKIKGFAGLKTGITPSAGPCLASFFQVSPSESILVILLDTLTVNHRFEQSKKLVLQTLVKLNKISSQRIYLEHILALNQQSAEVSRDEPLEDPNDFEPEQDNNDAVQQ